MGKESNENPKLLQMIIDFENDLMKDDTQLKEMLKDVDVVFCTLGTTRKAAQTVEGFKRVDYDYVAKIADIAKDGGVKHFFLLTSIGANPKSSFLYLQTKGRVCLYLHCCQLSCLVFVLVSHFIHFSFVKIEEYVKSKDFPRLSIFRPSLLITSRSESRPGQFS
jgi:oxidoreductase